MPRPELAKAPPTINAHKIRGILTLNNTVSTVFGQVGVRANKRLPPTELLSIDPGG